MCVAKLFVALYWTWVASEVLLQVVAHTSRRSGEVKDRGSLLLLLSAIFGSIWLSSWYRDMHGPTMLAGAAGIRIVALLLLVVGLAIRWTAIFTLGESFSTNVAIHATQTVHKDRPIPVGAAPFLLRNAADLRGHRDSPAQLGQPGDHVGLPPGRTALSHSR